MSEQRFQQCLVHVLENEGGWSDHPEDPGGATMRGVTLATYRRYRPGATKAQLRAIGMSELQTIYRDGYWVPSKAAQLPPGLDLVVFDAAVVKKLLVAVLMVVATLLLTACARANVEVSEDFKLFLSCPDPEGRKRLEEGATYRDLALSRAEAISGWQQCSDALNISQNVPQGLH